MDHFFTYYTPSDLPELQNNTVATFADKNTAILAVGRSNEEATEKLKTANNQIQNLDEEMRINELKSVHINFTNRHIDYIPVTINNHIVPHANAAKYLGVTLDTKLRLEGPCQKEKGRTRY